MGEKYLYSCQTTGASRVMNDPVREYLERQGYADYIIEGGVEYLLTSWESTVSSIIEGEVPDYTQYVKSMDRRRILEETLALIPLYQQAWYHQRVYEADHQLRQHLTVSEQPLCGPAVAAEKGYTPDRQWWYFHRPRRVNGAWPNAR